MQEKIAEPARCECGNHTFTIVDGDHCEDSMSSSTITCNACHKILFRICVAWVSGTTWLEYPQDKGEGA